MFPALYPFVCVYVCAHVRSSASSLIIFGGAMGRALFSHTVSFNKAITAGISREEGPVKSRCGVAILQCIQKISRRVLQIYAR